MTFKEYFTRLKVKNLKLLEAKELTITPASLETQLRAAYDAGFDHGKAIAGKVNETLYGAGGAGNSKADMIRAFFYGK